MSLPPVIERIRQKQVPDSEIRAYFSAPSPYAPESRTFRELAVRFAEHEQSAAVDLAHLPADHPFWAVAPRSQNFRDVVCAFLDYRLERDPGDVPAAWARVGFAVMGSMRLWLGGALWTAIVKKDLRNVRWLVESSIWIWLECGEDTTDDLKAVLVSLPGAAVRTLGELCSDTDSRVAAAARVALDIREGSRLPDLWTKYPTAVA